MPTHRLRNDAHLLRVRCVPISAQENANGEYRAAGVRAIFK